MGRATPSGSFRGRQNCTFEVDVMVCMKVFNGTENFWVRRKIFRVM